MAIVKVRVTLKDARLRAARAKAERFNTTNAMAKRVGAPSSMVKRFCALKDKDERVGIIRAMARDEIFYASRVNVESVSATRAMARNESFDTSKVNVESISATRAMTKRADTPRARAGTKSLYSPGTGSPPLENSKFWPAGERSSTRPLSSFGPLKKETASTDIDSCLRATVKRDNAPNANVERVGIAKSSNERAITSRVRYERLDSFRASDGRVGAARARDEREGGYKARDEVSQFSVRQFQHGKATRGESFSSARRTLKGNYVEEKEDQNFSLHGVRKRQRFSNYNRRDMNNNCESFDASQQCEPSLKVKDRSEVKKDLDDNDRSSVKRALLAYKEVLSKSTLTQKSNWCYVRAAMVLKKEGKWVNTTKQIGSIRGVRVGDRFRYRAQLNIVGLHKQFTNGIDHMRRNDGKILATSIVDSGRYVNNLQSSDILIYSGQGGKSPFDKTKPINQTMEGGNLALRNSQEEGTPIRVIRMLKHSKGCSCYVYYGLYTVEGVLQESEHGVMIYKFKLRRKAGQPELIFDST